MTLVRIAFRNLLRAPARTALSIIAVAASVIAVLLFKGTTTGVIGAMEDGTIRLAAGHVRLIHREYEKRERILSLQYPVDGFPGERAEGGAQGLDGVVAALRQLPHAQEVAPRIRFGGMISRDDELRNVLVIAGDPEVEARILRADRYVGEGRFIRRGQREAVLGRRLLNRLRLDVGDRVTVVFMSSTGALRGYTLDIVGAFESGLTYLDDGTVFIPLDVAQQAVDLESAATEVLVMAPRAKDADVLLAEVEALLEQKGAASEYTALPWYTFSEIIEWLQVGRIIYDFIAFIMLFLAGFVIINTFLMIVHERRREIGLLAALGLRPRHIRLLFLWEGGMCGLFGGAAGVIIGAPLLWYLSVAGISIPGVEVMDPELMYPTTFYPAFDLGIVAYAALGGILVTFLAAYMPARQASNLKPTDALRV